ncbi:MAG: acyl-CoA dehydrogenase N-terminal domain-containing protein [Steroidobacteraceae bacterium]
MTTYRAPLRDMQFALVEIAGLGGVAALPGYEDATAELADAILEPSVIWLAREIRVWRICLR